MQHLPLREAAKLCDLGTTQVNWLRGRARAAPARIRPFISHQGFWAA